MLIEHTSGSCRRQTRNRKMWWCVTAVNRMLQPAKSPWSANPECVTTVLQSATESTQVNSKKSQRCPEKVNAGQQAKSQRSSNFGQPFDLGSCAKVYGLLKSKSPQVLGLFGPCVDQSQRWSNFLQNPSCRNSSFSSAVQIRPPSSSHVWAELVLQGARTKSEKKMCVELC